MTGISPVCSSRVLMNPLCFVQFYTNPTTGLAKTNPKSHDYAICFGQFCGERKIGTAIYTVFPYDSQTSRSPHGVVTDLLCLLLQSRKNISVLLYIQNKVQRPSIPTLRSSMNREAIIICLAEDGVHFDGPVTSEQIYRHLRTLRGKPGLTHMLADLDWHVVVRKLCGDPPLEAQLSHP